MGKLVGATGIEPTSSTMRYHSLLGTGDAAQNRSADSQGLNLASSDVAYPHIHSVV